MADITLDQIVVDVVVETGEVTLKPGTQELIDKAVYSLIKDSPVRHLAPELKVDPKIAINKERIREQLDQAIREIDKKISELHGVNADLKLIQFLKKCRFKSDTPLLRYRAAAIVVGTPLALTIPAAR
jgi:hypothetical protein